MVRGCGVGVVQVTIDVTGHRTKQTPSFVTGNSIYDQDVGHITVLLRATAPMSLPVIEEAVKWMSMKLYGHDMMGNIMPLVRKAVLVCYHMKQLIDITDVSTITASQILIMGITCAEGTTNIENTAADFILYIEN